MSTPRILDTSALLRGPQPQVIDTSALLRGPRPQVIDTSALLQGPRPQVIDVAALLNGGVPQPHVRVLEPRPGVFRPQVSTRAGVPVPLTHRETATKPCCGDCAEAAPGAAPCAKAVVPHARPPGQWLSVEGRDVQQRVGRHASRDFRLPELPGGRPRRLREPGRARPVGLTGCGSLPPSVVCYDGTSVRCYPFTPAQIACLQSIFARVPDFWGMAQTLPCLAELPPGVAWCAADPRDASPDPRDRVNYADQPPFRSGRGRSASLLT